MLQRLIKDPIALALILTVPCLCFVQYSRSSNWSSGFLFTRGMDSIREEYNFTALTIIWAVAIIRWKWQKEDKAEQTGK